MGLRSFFRLAAMWLVAGILVFGLMRLSPFSPIDTLRHIAAFPNCAAARAVGVAPANRGEPGYWPQHDRDGDGVACEPWLRSRRRAY